MRKSLKKTNGNVYNKTKKSHPSSRDNVALFRKSFINLGVNRSVLLASTFRSGSTYIGEIIQANGISGLTYEKFRMIWEAADYSQKNLRKTFDAIAATASDDLFATKIMWPHRNDLASVLGLNRSRSAEFASLFPNAKWIYVKRQDIFGQAVSMWKAKNTGVWHKYENGEDQNGELSYDFAAIDRCLCELSLHNRLWEDFFSVSGIEPYCVEYEDLLEDTEAKLKPLLAHIGLPNETCITKVALQMQRDSSSSSIRERLLADLFEAGR